MNICDINYLLSLYFSPVVIEVPNFAALRGNEREIVILRSDNGETWREHTVDSSNEAVQEILSRSFDKDGSELKVEASLGWYLLAVLIEI